MNYKRFSVSTSQMATGNLSVTDRESCYVTLVTCPSIEVAKTLSRSVFYFTERGSSMQ